MTAINNAFKAKMASLSNAGIIDAISQTWNAPEGGIFRDYGFEILEDRLGEDEADRIYNELWVKFN